METKKVGRPSKGPRNEVRAKLPVQLAEALQAEAARLGITVTDLIGHMAAERTGVPYATQEGLSLSA
jgi:hypothetical protein